MNVNGVFIIIGIGFFIILFGILLSQYVESQNQGLLNSFNNSKINLQIDEISVGDSPTGLISVNGVVRNNSTENIENVKVEVKLFDSNNAIIIETERFITASSSIFKPGYESDFDFLMTARNVDHYNMTSYGDKVQ
ncbi:MAG: hypothetical protein H0X03_00530 [Nitrosopumilus sp.]|nr:hypothetical protein [Nitrosopumilus sp.]